MTDALDAMFGYRWVTLRVEEGEVEQRYKLRVMLTRRQARVIRAAQTTSVELMQLAQRQMKLIKDAAEQGSDDAANAELMTSITEEMEREEDRLADSYYEALNVLIIDLPPEFKELSSATLAQLYRQLTERQSEELREYVRTDTAHPTPASTG